VQVIQGLLYDFVQHTWPTNVDLMDAMLLLSRTTGASQVLLKVILGALAAAYLYFFLRGYRRFSSRRDATQLQPEKP
jgi:hypothetical protein